MSCHRHLCVPKSISLQPRGQYCDFPPIIFAQNHTDRPDVLNLSINKRACYFQPVLRPPQRPLSRAPPNDFGSNYAIITGDPYPLAAFFDGHHRSSAKKHGKCVMISKICSDIKKYIITSKMLSNSMQSGNDVTSKSMYITPSKSTLKLRKVWKVYHDTFVSTKYILTLKNMF